MNYPTPRLPKFEEASLRGQGERNCNLQYAPPEQRKPRIFCVVYTYEGAHATNLQAIVDTWASQCDGLFLAGGSYVTDITL